jgi:hypothetical protein
VRQQQQVPRRRRRQAHAAVPRAYAELLNYCDLCARSASMVDWIKGEQQEWQWLTDWWAAHWRVCVVC